MPNADDIHRQALAEKPKALDDTIKAAQLTTAIAFLSSLAKRRKLARLQKFQVQRRHPDKY